MQARSKIDSRRLGKDTRMLRMALAASMLAVTCMLAGGTAALGRDLTPAQTEGPYYPRQLPADRDADLTRVGSQPVAKGELLRLAVRVVDPQGVPIEGARVEIWQVDHQGIYLHPGDPGFRRRDPNFQGYGEARSDAAGRSAFTTILPPPYEGRPKHIHAKITPAGGPTLTTQFYFAGDPLLGRDGITRRLGKALDLVTLQPKPLPSGQGQQAQIDIVVARRR